MLSKKGQSAFGRPFNPLKKEAAQAFLDKYLSEEVSGDIKPEYLYSRYPFPLFSTKREKEDTVEHLNNGT